MIGTKVAVTYTNIPYHGTIARTNTEQHTTILLDKLYKPLDISTNRPVCKTAVFTNAHLTDVRLSDDELLIDVFSFNIAMTFVEIYMHKEKES